MLSAIKLSVLADIRHQVDKMIPNPGVIVVFSGLGKVRQVRTEVNHTKFCTLAPINHTDRLAGVRKKNHQSKISNTLNRLLPHWRSQNLDFS